MKPTFSSSRTQSVHFFIHHLPKTIYLLFILLSYIESPIYAQSGGNNSTPDLNVDLEVTCNGIIAHCSGFSQWPTHYWDFGDGSPILSGGPELADVDHLYQDINPNITTITVRHSLDQSFWLEQQLIFPGIFAGAGCGSVRRVSELVNQGLLPVGKIENSTLYIFGDFEVDVPYIFETCEIKAMPGARIVVIAGGKLTIQIATTLDGLNNSSCPNLWEGITVESGASLVTNLSTIQNARLGIRPIHNNNTLTVPRLRLFDTDFKSNFIGICADSGPFLLSDFSGNTFWGAGNGNILTTSLCNNPIPINGIPFTQKTYCGIYYNGIHGGEFYIPPISFKENIFRDLQAGIVCLNGNTFINKSTFENIRTISGNTAPYQGTAISFVDFKGNNSLSVNGLGKDHSPTIQNCERGVHANSAGGFSMAEIKNCRIAFVQNGVLVEEAINGNFNSVTILDNYIECSRHFTSHNTSTSTGVDIHDPSPLYSKIVIEGNEFDINQPDAFGPIYGVLNPTAINISTILPQISIPTNHSMNVQVDRNDIVLTNGFGGIHLSNVPNAIVNDNSIESITTSPNRTTIGILISGGINNSIKCNKISAQGQILDFIPRVGIYVDESVNFILSGNATSNLRSCISLLNDNGTDCAILSNDIIHQNVHSVGLFYNDALTGPQYLRGNQWIDNFDTGAGYSSGPNGFSFCNSKFHVSEDANIASANSNLVVAPQQPCGAWFNVIELAEPHYPCASPIPSFSLELNEADINLAAGGTSNLQAGFKWSTEMGLYRKFSETPELIENDLVITNFMANQDEQPISFVYEIRKNFVELFENLTLEEQLLDLQEQARGIRSEMNELLVHIDNTPGTLIEWGVLNEQLSYLNQNAQILLAIWQQETNSAANMIIAKNSAIICPGQPCAYEQFLYGLFLETRITDPREPTYTEKEQIKEIAETCPRDGGPAVFLARSWYYWLTGELLKDSCSNPLPNESYLEQRNQPISSPQYANLNTQPNPAQDWVNITIPVLDMDTDLLIYNVWGQMVRQFEIRNDNNTSIPMPTSALISGFYTVFLVEKGSGKPISQTKMIVAH
ncbi:MAG: hypothetical protein IT260_15880 [Saprospiraceae bacterium]|nr:hypothetical protein [Saprospiraceae bacterium]